MSENLEIFIEPPEVGVLTDEDSAEEDEGVLVDNLSGRMLRVCVHTRQIMFLRSIMQLRKMLLFPPLVKALHIHLMKALLIRPVKVLQILLFKALPCHLKVHKEDPTNYTWMRGDFQQRAKIFPEADFSRYSDFFPLELFELLFDDEIIDMIRIESEKYVPFLNRENPNITVQELKTFIGILLLSGYNNLPGKRLYWDSLSHMRNQMVYELL